MAQDFAPVFIWISPGVRLSVSDVMKAADILLNRWPREFISTPTHLAAREACLQAWEGQKGYDLARSAFIAAAAEADILATAPVRPRR